MLLTSPGINRWPSGRKVELTGADQARWLDLLEADHDTLLVALASGRERARRWRRQCGFSVPWSQFWLVRGRLTEGRRTAWRMPSPDVHRPTRCASRRCGCWAYLACFAGDYDRAGDAADEARALARRLESRQVGSPRRHAARSGRERTRPTGKRRNNVTAAAVEGARAAGDRWCYACALNNLGNVLTLQGAASAARDSYEESLAVRRLDGDALGMSWVLFRLGVLATWECRFAEATALLEESLQQSTMIRFGQGTLLAQLGLGETLYVSGDDRVPPAGSPTPWPRPVS